MTTELTYIVRVRVDADAVLEDYVPEDVPKAIKDEILSTFGDSSVRRALGVVAVAVDLVDAGDDPFVGRG